jgi:8-oxo-dGTP pyrophosphatase MutT (NUDIX family)
MSSIWKPHVVAATVIERDGRYLCVEEDIDGRRVINQPAGHLDPGESLLDAAIRETLEETAWHVRLDSLLGVYLMQTDDPDKTYLRFCFAATTVTHEPTRQLDKEIVRTHWFSREDLLARQAELRSTLVMAAVEAFESGLRYPLDMIHAHLKR